MIWANSGEEVTPYHSQGADELSQEVVLVELRGTLVFIKHGEAKLLYLLEVVVHLELHPKHRVQVVHSCFSAAQLQHRKRGDKGGKTFSATKSL